MQSRPKSVLPIQVEWFACALVCGWAAWNWAKLIALLRQSWTSAPLLDYWRIVANIPRYERFDLSVFWIQHNEHRIVFPELAMAADALFLSGRATLPLVLGFGFQWLTLAVYAAMVWKRLDRNLRFFVIVLGSGLIGWPGMALFFAHPFLSQWLFVQLGVVLALAALPRSTGAAIAAGVVANFSAANGLLIWPILILAAIALQLNRRRILILAVAGTFFTALYFAGYHPGPNLRFGVLFQHPVLALKWAAAYLSLPFGFADGDTGLLFGLGGILLFVALLAFSFRRMQSAPALFLGAALFVIGSTILATAGRMPTDHAVLSPDLDLRFVVMPLWFWLSLLFASAYTLGSWTKWNWIPLLPAGAVIAMGMSSTSAWIAARGPEYEKNRFAGLALEAGIIDATIVSDTLYYDPEFIERYVANLTQRKLSVFASGRFERRGKTIASLFPAGQVGSLREEVVSVSLIDGGMELRGSRTYGTADIVIANQDGIVVGSGGRFGSGWVAFANLDVPSTALRVFLVDGNKLEVMSPSVPVPDATPVRHAQMGQFLPGIEWETNGGFAKSHFGPELGLPPFGTVYGNWTPVGGSPGELVSSAFEAPPGNCIVLPAGHSAPLPGEAIELFDAEKRTRLATIPIGTADNTWRSWRIYLPAGTRTLRIAAHASDATRWVAVAQPARCTSSYQ
jgi:hypothetical protein